MGAAAGCQCHRGPGDQRARRENQDNQDTLYPNREVRTLSAQLLDTRHPHYGTGEPYCTLDYKSRSSALSYRKSSTGEFDCASVPMRTLRDCLIILLTYELGLETRTSTL